MLKTSELMLIYYAAGSGYPYQPSFIQRLDLLIYWTVKMKALKLQTCGDIVYRPEAESIISLRSYLENPEFNHGYPNAIHSVGKGNR